MPSPPIRILYVITDLELGGVPLHLFRLAREMKRRGLAPSVISLAKPGPVAQMIRSEGVSVESCEACCGWDIRVFHRLAKSIKTAQPDVVHSFLFHANFAARRAARRAGLPPDRVLCEIQTVEVERKWHLWVDGWSHRGCRFTIGNSPSVIQHLHRHAGIPMQRLRLVKGGIDSEAVERAQPADRGALRTPSEAKIVLWVGRLDPVKGLGLLIDAFAPLVSAHNAYLCLAGDGPIRQRLERQVERCALVGRVRFLGPRRDVASLLKIADVFALPSRTEGLPNALLEAMAAGCPIVTTDAPGCRDLVEPEVSGLRVPYGDTKRLTEALARLLTDRGLASRLGRRAAEVARSDWRISDTYAGYERCYEEAVSSAK